MRNSNWRIWNKKNSAERTTQRLNNKLPPSECSKQLLSILLKIYRPGMKVLDFGCAAGHYYKVLRKLDKNLKYFGFDATHHYIKYAKKYFKKNYNTHFEKQDLFSLPKKHFNKYDITYCCNVLLHLPSIETPIKNLIKSSRKYCVIRTLVSKQTHLSKDLHTDDIDKRGNPKFFVYQNTYSYDKIIKSINKFGKFKIDSVVEYF